MTQTIKSILREPRPLMVDEDIKIKDCKHLEFGNPSAHTFGSSYLFITTFVLVYRQFSVRYGIKLSL